MLFFHIRLGIPSGIFPSAFLKFCEHFIFGMRVTWPTHLKILYLVMLIVLVWRKNVLILFLSLLLAPKLQFARKPVLSNFPVSCPAVWRRVFRRIFTEVLEEPLAVAFTGSGNCNVGSADSHVLKTEAGGCSETTKLYCVLFEKVITNISCMFCSLHKNRKFYVGLIASSTKCSRKTSTMKSGKCIYIYIWSNWLRH